MTSTVPLMLPPASERGAATFEVDDDPTEEGATSARPTVEVELPDHPRPEEADAWRAGEL